MTVLQVMQKLHDDVNEFGLRSFVTGVRHAATTIAQRLATFGCCRDRTQKGPETLRFRAFPLKGYILRSW